MRHDVQSKCILLFYLYDTTSSHQVFVSYLSLGHFHMMIGSKSSSISLWARVWLCSVLCVWVSSKSGPMYWKPIEVFVSSWQSVSVLCTHLSLAACGWWSTAESGSLLLAVLTVLLSLLSWTWLQHESNVVIFLVYMDSMLRNGVIK